MKFTRRNFLATTAIGSVAMGLEAQVTTKRDGKAREVVQEAGPVGGPPQQPVLISSLNGWNGMDKAHQIVSQGGDTLDAAIAVGKTQEDDPNDQSVGLGGLPNEDGVVELDSCCMHGPTRRAGSVGGVRNIKNVSLLAQAVMNHTGHVMLVAEGAERFAYVMGFPKENLLTERSRKVWQLWKEYHSYADWWGPGIADPTYKLPNPKTEALKQQVDRLDKLAAEIGIPRADRTDAITAVLFPRHGTCHCGVVNPKGEMSSMTTTSGLSWKLAGRVGDSPIIGAGNFCDQDVGSAGATGSGEENIRVAGAHSIIENMRKGMSPREAGMDVLRRVAKLYNNDMQKLNYVSMHYYILRKDGVYAGVSMWSGAAGNPFTFTVHKNGQRSKETAVPLFQGAGDGEYPPIPAILREKWRTIGSE